MNQRSAPSTAAPARAVSSRSLVGRDPQPRRQLLRGAAGLGLGGASLPLLAGCTRATPPSKPSATKARLGVLSTGPGPQVPEFEGLRRGLRELGYVDGQHIAFEYRFAQDKPDAFPRFAAELIALKVDVI